MKIILSNLKLNGGKENLKVRKIYIAQIKTNIEVGKLVYACNFFKSLQ